MIQKEEKITRGKQAEHQHKNIIRHECRCRCQWWGRWINALFLLRDQICLFSLVSTLFAAELWRKREKPEKELKQRMRDDSLRGEDEHIRQELPGNNWVTLWWSATIISKCSRGRQSNQSDLINIKTALVFWCTRMHVIVWQRWCYLTCHLACWRQSSVQESEEDVGLLIKHWSGVLILHDMAFHKDVALSCTPSPPLSFSSRLSFLDRTPSTSQDCKYVYYSTSLCLNLTTWGYPSFWPVFHVWRL